MTEDSELGRFGMAIGALFAAPPETRIPISHDFWKVSDQYRRARWQRVQDVLAKGEALNLDVRHHGGCCSSSDGDQRLREELASVLRGPEPQTSGHDDADDEL